jgi:hypothetical protein
LIGITASETVEPATEAGPINHIVVVAGIAWIRRIALPIAAIEGGKGGVAAGKV